MMVRGLQVLLAAIGVVAVVAGLITVLAGADSLLGVGEVEAPVDNEMRFYAAFWVALGGVALWVAPRAEQETGVVRAIAAAIFLGGLARIVSIASVGEPHSSQYVLMGIELAIPPILVGWQAALERRFAGRD
jgi:uncharacterized protein DUF4345